MSSSGDFGNPLRKFKLVFLGEQSGEYFTAHTSVDSGSISELYVVGIVLTMISLALSKRILMTCISSDNHSRF